MKGNTLVTKKINIFNMTRAGILIAISLVLSFIFQIEIPIAGFSAVRLSFSTIVIMLSGFICGPATGFATGVLVDVLKFALKPSGVYFPGFTLAAGLSGFIPAFLNKHLKKDLNYNLINTISILLLSFSFASIFFIKDVLVIENGVLMYNSAPVSMAYIIGFIVLVAIYIAMPIYITRKFNKHVDMSKTLFTVSVSNFITSIILNTYCLSILYGKGFIIFLPGRILSNFFIIPIYAIVLTSAIATINKNFKTYN